MKNKRILLLSLVLIFSMIFAACGSSQNEEESESEVGVANPWSDVGSAEEAAEGASIDSFTVPEGAEISLGTVNIETYRCMEGLAEVHSPVGAVEMTIRKGLDSTAESGDVSGDYGEYKHEWKSVIDGVEVNCYGNREGEATKTLWKAGDYCYSIVAIGAGGDSDFGLSPEDLAIIVSGTK